MFFFFDYTATTDICTYRHTLSPLDALPILRRVCISAAETGESIAGEGMDGNRRVLRPSRPSRLCVMMCRDHWASVPARPTIRFAAPARMVAQHLRAGRGNRLARPSFAAGPCPTLTSEPRLL